jgi:hypothetical protein
MTALTIPRPTQDFPPMPSDLYQVAKLVLEDRLSYQAAATLLHTSREDIQTRVHQARLWLLGAKAATFPDSAALEVTEVLAEVVKPVEVRV